MAACALPAAAEVVTLRDGSAFHGTLTGVSGDSYVVESTTLGRIEIPRADVVSIDTAGAAAPGAAADVDALRARLLADPAAMSSIMGLANDPAVRALLNDAEAMRAVESLDLDTLADDPRIRDLMTRPAIRNLGAGLD
ncbi:MAG: hypothetical protein ACU85V_13255 [Gammaproteobacteria bacterium]